MPAIWDPLKSALQKANAVLSLELHNEGSVARDHLASERTFLAWLRTSLSLVGIGIAVTQLFQIPSLIGDTNFSPPSRNAVYFPDDGIEVIGFGIDARQLGQDRLANAANLGKPLGGAFILLGILVLMLGCSRYFSVQAHLVRGKFVPSRAGVSLVGFLVAVLVVTASAIILARRNT